MTVKRIFDGENPDATTFIFKDDDGMQVQENWAADGFVNMVGADAVCCFPRRRARQRPTTLLSCIPAASQRSPIVLMIIYQRRCMKPIFGELMCH